MFVVVYDANVLYPSALRDLLIRIAQAGLVQPKWTHHILDETFRNLAKIGLTLIRTSFTAPANS